MCSSNMADAVVSEVRQYKKYLEKYLTREPDTEKLVRVLKKLDKLPVTLDHLQETGIGKTVNSYRKHGDQLGERARSLVNKWKNLVCFDPPSPAKSSPKNVPLLQTETISETPYKVVSNHSSHQRAPYMHELSPAKDKDKLKTDFSHSKSSKNSTKVSHSGSDSKHRKHQERQSGVDQPLDQHKHKSHSSGKDKHHHRQEKHDSVGKDPHRNKDSSRDYQRKREGEKKKQSKSLTEEEGTSSSSKYKYSQLVNEIDEDELPAATSADDVDNGDDEDKAGMSFEDLLNYDTKVKPRKKAKHYSKESKEKHRNSEGRKEHSSNSREKTSHHDKKHHKHKHHSKSSDHRTRDEKSSSKKHDKHKPDLLDSKKVNHSNDTIKRKASAEPPIAVPPPKQIRLSGEDIMAGLPEITPNYHPLPRPPADTESPSVSKGGGPVDDEIIGSKSHSRTLIYSGKKTRHITSVPKLFDMCIRVMIDNIDGLGETGGVPFDILKPVLEVCTPAQLFDLENLNPHFVGDSDELWKKHCSREFRMAKPDEFESWRELYLRKHDERESKLKSLTASISATVQKSQGESRKTKLAYVDIQAKPPRGVRRQQQKHGTAGPSVADPLKRLSSHGGAKSAPKAPIPISYPAERKQPKMTKTIAPMMARTMKQMKNFRYGK